MKVYQSMSVFAAVLIAGLVAGGGSSVGQEKERPVKVTLEELAKDPAKFQGKRVQVEGMIQQTQMLKEKQGEFEYRLVIGKDGFLMAWCSGKLAVRKGESVRITGKFRHDTALANPYQILAAGEAGKVEKVGPK